MSNNNNNDNKNDTVNFIGEAFAVMPFNLKGPVYYTC